MHTPSGRLVQISAYVLAAMLICQLCQTDLAGALTLMSPLDLR